MESFMETEYVQVEATVVRMTSRAVLLRSESGRDQWVPQSQIFEDDLNEMAEGVVLEVNIAKWFFDKEMA
jgi:hypothetical protein